MCTGDFEGILDPSTSVSWYAERQSSRASISRRKHNHWSVCWAGAKAVPPSKSYCTAHVRHGQALVK